MTAAGLKYSSSRRRQHRPGQNRQGDLIPMSQLQSLDGLVNKQLWVGWEGLWPISPGRSVR